MISYLKEHKLFADEPSINIRQTHAQLSIQVDTNQHVALPCKNQYELAMRKA